MFVKTRPITFTRSTVYSKYPNRITLKNNRNNFAKKKVETFAKIFRLNLLIIRNNK
jgi:hypothetical protein